MNRSILGADVQRLSKASCLLVTQDIHDGYARERRLYDRWEFYLPGTCDFAGQGKGHVLCNDS